MRFKKHWREMRTLAREGAFTVYESVEEMHSLVWWSLEGVSMWGGSTSAIMSMIKKSSFKKL